MNDAQRSEVLGNLIVKSLLKRRLGELLYRSANDGALYEAVEDAEAITKAIADAGLVVVPDRLLEDSSFLACLLTAKGFNEICREKATEHIHEVNKYRGRENVRS